MFLTDGSPADQFLSGSFSRRNFGVRRMRLLIIMGLKVDDVIALMK
jgi:hypothetical protein